MGSNQIEITIKDTKALFVLVGESVTNSKFLKICVIKNDLLVINTDNKEISDFSQTTQVVNKQINYDELNTKFKSDVIDLMFYGPLKNEFYCIQVATEMQDYLQVYNSITIFSSNLIPISTVTNIELKNFKNIFVERRFQSIATYNDTEKRTVNAIDKMGPLNYSKITLNPDSRIEEWSELICAVIKKNGHPQDAFTVGTSLALSTELLSVEAHEMILTPWNFNENGDRQKFFLDSSYLNKIGISWATQLPSDITGKEFSEIARILDFNIEESIKSSSYDLNVRSVLDWSNKVKSKIIGNYYLDTQNNDAYIDTIKFKNWATSFGKRVTILNRLEETIYLSRPDLTTAFPANSINFKQDFSKWFGSFGINEIFLENKYEFISNILKKSTLYNTYGNKEKLRTGFNVIGYQKYQLGLGMAARQYKKILNNLEIETSNFNLKNTMSGVHRESQSEIKSLPFDKNFVVIGADQIPELAILGNHDWSTSRYNVGAIFWETDFFPLKISNALSIFDEFVVSSNYVANNLKKFTDRKISVVGLQIQSENEIPTKEISDKKITVYFNFDYLSDIYRKNVFTLIDYVQRKNKDSNNMFNLILKSINGKFYPLEQAYVSKLISADDSIREIDGFLDSHEYQKLLKSVDLYISLHRSEGFGLGLAEAMNLGIPTMATAYSGNLDFMKSDNSYLVDFDLELIENTRRSPYSEFGGSWAQPKFESFSRQIDNFLSQPEDRLLRIEKAKNVISSEFSETSITIKMKNALRSSGII